MVGSDLGNIGETKRRLESNHQSFLLVDFPRYNCVKIKLLPEGKRLKLCPTPCSVSRAKSFNWLFFLVGLFTFCWRGGNGQTRPASCSRGPGDCGRWDSRSPPDDRDQQTRSPPGQPRLYDRRLALRWGGGEALFLKQCCGCGLWIQIREDLLCTLCLLDPDPNV